MSTEGLIPTRRPVPDTLFGGRLRGAYLLDLEVIDIRDLAPHVRSITVASTDLIDFEYAPGQDLLIEFPRGGSTVRRRYTIRRSGPAGGTAEFEFELHDGVGAATLWAAQAKPGDRLEAIGPRGGIGLRTAATHHLFVVDDSAMPAAFAMLDALPLGTSATALLVTAHGAESRPVPASASKTTMKWIDRSEMAEGVAGLVPRPGTAAYVFGERQLVRTAEEVLAALGVPRDAISSKAYWRQDQPNASHGEPSID
jgi:NADPH-dependent ferric siderophore reductase